MQPEKSRKISATLRLGVEKTFSHRAANSLAQPISTFQYFRSTLVASRLKNISICLAQAVFEFEERCFCRKVVSDLEQIRDE